MDNQDTENSDFHRRFWEVAVHKIVLLENEGKKNEADKLGQAFIAEVGLEESRRIYWEVIEGTATYQIVVRDGEDYSKSSRKSRLNWEGKEFVYIGGFCLIVGFIFAFISELVSIIAACLAVISYTVFVIDAINDSVRNDRNSLSAIGFFVGIYALAGLISLIFIYAWVGYLILILAAILGIYGFHSQDTFSNDKGTRSFLIQPPRPVPPVDNDDPLGVRPYANRVRPRTNGESETPR